MEGACGKILEESSTTVRKVMKRNAKGLSAEHQALLQQLVADVLQRENLKTLMTPRVLSIESKSYVMERVDDSLPLYEARTLRPEWIKEIQIFLYCMEQEGWLMNDIELYVQVDGRIAILDFDKCEPTGPGKHRKANAFLQGL